MELGRSTNPVKAFQLFQSLIANLTSDESSPEESWRGDYLEARLLHTNKTIPVPLLIICFS